MAHGPGYPQEGVPSAYRPIGYPLVLAVLFRLFGESWWVPALFQVLASTAVVAVTGALATRLFGPAVGLAAAGLMALAPDQIVWSSVLASEIPFMLWMLLGVLLWVPPRESGSGEPVRLAVRRPVHFVLQQPAQRRFGAEPPADRDDRPAQNEEGEGSPAADAPPDSAEANGSQSWLRLLVSGLFLGLAALTRPVLLPAPGLFFLYEVLCSGGRGRWRGRTLWRRALGGALAVALGMALVVGPWTWRNYRALGAFVPVSTNGGVNLWQGNNPHTNGEFFWSDDPHLNPLLEVQDEVERDRLGRQLALAWIRENPRQFLQLGWKKWGLLLGDNHSAPYFSVGQARTAVAPWLEPLTVAALAWGLNLMLALAALGLLLWLGMGRRFGGWGRTSLPLLLILWMLALHFVFPAWDRFRLPFTPFFWMLAGLAVTVPWWWGFRPAAAKAASPKPDPDPALGHGRGQDHG